MDSSTQALERDSEIIDISQLIMVVWKKKLLITIITIIFSLLSIFYALSIPNQYTASVLLAPAKQEDGGLFNALNNRPALFGGLGIGTKETLESVVAQEIMVSESFIKNFILSLDSDKEIYATTGWDPVSQEYKYDGEIYDVHLKKWLQKNKMTGEIKKPSLWQLYTKFKSKVDVRSDKTSGLVTVDMTDFSPISAKDWLDKYIVALNEHMQARQVRKATKNIDYLRGRASETSIAEAKEVLYTIINEQIKAKLLAEANPEYAFVTVNPSVVPVLKSRPSRALICILGTFFGGVLGVMYVLIRHFSNHLPIWRVMENFTKQLYDKTTIPKVNAIESERTSLKNKS